MKTELEEVLARITELEAKVAVLEARPIYRPALVFGPENWGPTNPGSNVNVVPWLNAGPAPIGRIV